MAEALQKERETYEKMKHDLLPDEGKFAVISGDQLLGVYANYEDALKIGYEKCQLKPFLVQKISATEPVNFFSRDVFEHHATSNAKH